MDTITPNRKKATKSAEVSTFVPVSFNEQIFMRMPAYMIGTMAMYWFIENCCK